MFNAGSQGNVKFDDNPERLKQFTTTIIDLNLQIPIFSGGLTSAKVQQAQIEVDQSNLRISKFENEIFTEIKNLELKLQEAEKRIASAESTFKTAKKAFGAIRRRIKDVQR